MKPIKILIQIIAVILLLNGCYHPYQREQKQEEVKISKTVPDLKTTQSIMIPKDRDVTPIVGESLVNNPDTVITVSAIGQKFEVKAGQEVNIIYEEGIDPEATFFFYEQTLDGYSLELRKRNDELDLIFNKICQLYIVASPNLTNVEVPPELKYEQIIWTPRADGAWEVRIGTTERGCKSKALQELKNLRTKEYENSVPK